MSRRRRLIRRRKVQDITKNVKEDVSWRDYIFIYFVWHLSIIWNSFPHIRTVFLQIVAKMMESKMVCLSSLSSKIIFALLIPQLTLRMLCMF